MGCSFVWISYRYQILKFLSNVVFIVYFVSKGANQDEQKGQEYSDTGCQKILEYLN